MTSSTIKSLGANYESTELNGVKIHLFKRIGAPIYIRFIFNAGSRYNKNDGVAHFLEHMLVAGTEKFPTKDLLAEYIENVGGRFSLSTSSDYIKLNVEVSGKDDLPIATTVLDQILNRSRFATESFESERGSILAEIVNKKSNPKEFVWEVYKRLFFQNTSLALPNLGEPESVSKISLNELLEFKKQLLTPENMSVIVSGDVQIDEIHNNLRKVLEATKNNAVHICDKAPSVTKKKYDFEKYESKQANIIAGFRIDINDLSDKVCSDICASYMADGRASLLAKELRYKRGLIYDVSPINETFVDRATFAIKTGCETPLFRKTLFSIIEQIDNFINNGISDEKITFIKSKIAKSLRTKLQTSESWVNHNEQYLVSPRVITNLDEYISTLQKIDAPLINNFIRKNLIRDKLLIAVCGTNETEAILKNLEP